jgi:hypothetical protein
MASKGGKRPGAGRKPSTLKGIAKKLPRESAELLLSEINANAKWVALANSDDERIQLEVLKYLSDRAYGKPRQDNTVAVAPIHGARTLSDFYADNVREMTDEQFNAIIMANTTEDKLAALGTGGK